MATVRVGFLVFVCFEALCCINGDTLNTTKISSIQPLYGPISGGTNITIQGSDLDPYGQSEENVLTLAGLLECETLQWNDSLVIVSTPQFDIAATICTSIAALELMYGWILLNYTFTYQPNPVIDSVEPREAIASGGIRLTVRGRNLDSVAQTILTVTRVDKDNETFQSPCEKAESTRMICLTPKLEIEDKNRRKRDSVSTTNDNSPWNPTRANFKMSSRSKREPDQARLQYYLGFIQDGFPVYRDLRNTNLPAFLIFTAGNPEIEGWDDVKKHKVGDSILIQGRHMTTGCTVHDYVVSVGEGHCSNLDLASTSLRCHPPKNKPKKIKTNASSGDYHVFVSVGYYQTYVGLLKYTKGKWYEDPLILAGIGAGVGLLVLVILVSIGLFHCRQKRDSSSNVQQQPQQPDSPGTNEGHEPDGRRIRRLPLVNDSYLHCNSEGYESPAQQPGRYLEPAH